MRVLTILITGPDTGLYTLYLVKGPAILGASRGARALLKKRGKKEEKVKEGRKRERAKKGEGRKEKEKRLCWLETRAPRGARAPLPP